MHFDGWQPSLWEAWNTCNWFNDELNDSDTHVFYYNLNGKKFFLESQGDHQANLDAPDDVDLLFMYTWGGAWTNTSGWAMWDRNTFAESASMRLGDSAWWGGGLAVLATYSSWVLLYDNDTNFVNRWLPAMSGGLKHVLASHGILNYGSSTNEVGEDFADELQSGAYYPVTVTSAWYHGLSDFWSEQDIATLTTGTDVNDCWLRKDSMRWQDVGSFPFRRDGQIGFMCLNLWDNI